MKNALERAGNWGPNGIRDALKKTDMMTAFGPVKFEDRDGYQNQNFVPTLAIEVIHQQFATIWPEKLASARYVYPIPAWRERR